MKKIVATLMAMLIVTSVMVTIAFAGAGVAKEDKFDPAVNSEYNANALEYGRLCLQNKNDSDWKVIHDRTYGILWYKRAAPTFQYLFFGRGLEPKIEYCLVYYADRDNRFVNWGGDNPGALIGQGTPSRRGKLLLMGKPDLDMDLPCCCNVSECAGRDGPDWNCCPDPDYCDYNNLLDDYRHCSGAKIWLVPCSDYNDADRILSAWNPEEYLFETDLIWYDDTDVENCEPCEFFPDE